MRIGFREGAIPFAFAGHGGRSWGYSIDICHSIVEEFGRALGEIVRGVEYVPVTAADRVQQVADGGRALGSTNDAAVRALARRPGGAFRIEAADDFARAFELPGLPPDPPAPRQPVAGGGQ